MDNKVKRYICGLFVNDAIGYFFLLAIILISSAYFELVVPIIFMAITSVTFLFMRLRRESKLYKSDSYRITYTITRGLLFSSIFSVLATILYLVLVVKFDIEILKLRAILMFATLYLFIFLLITSNSQYKRPNKSVFMMYSTLKYGHIFERLYLGQYIYINDIRVVQNIYRIVCMLLFLIWGYFFLIFKDWGVSIQDQIIFTTVPFVVAIAAVVDGVVAANFKKRNLENIFDGDNSDNKSLHKLNNLCVRAMLICGNKVYLNLKNEHYDQGLHEDFKPEDAEYNERELNLKKIFKLKKIAYSSKLYDNEDIIISSRVKRFVIFVDDINDVEPREGCSWVDVEDIPYFGIISEHFKFEWLRVLTFINTHKLFNADGTLKDKNVKCVEDIRLLDIVDHKIDFNDTDVMKLSIFNCNTKFYRFKRTWFKYVEGIID
ncbi:MAG: hypothetical protein R3Y22_05655 [Bacteroidales bacterium]